MPSASITRSGTTRAACSSRKPYHDWTSHGADEYRYAAVAEDQMTNAMPMPPPTLGLVKPFPGMPR